MVKCIFNLCWPLRNVLSVKRSDGGQLFGARRRTESKCLDGVGSSSKTDRRSRNRKNINQGDP